MALFQYACPDCGREKEVRHGMKETVNVLCIRCGDSMRRVYHPIVPTFHGHGFYSTDNRVAKTPLEAQG